MSPRAIKEWIGRTPDSKAPPRVLLRIFEREDGRCHLSGRKIAAGERWQAEHKVAIINGGENRESNLFPALIEPHKAKTRDDMKEKARVAKRAKSHIGATRPAGKLKSASFPHVVRPHADRGAAMGVSEIARRFAGEGKGA